MALQDRLDNPPVRTTGQPCSVGALIGQLKGKELAAFQVMLGTPENWGWSQDEIYAALTAEGYQVGRQTINRHRGGKCKCARS
jgi:hypothetical protein